jgi:hypothetical protein
LLTNKNYRDSLQTALNKTQNRESTPAFTVNTTALKMNVRIKDKIIAAIPDSGAAMSIISTRLLKELRIPYTTKASQPV